MSNEAEMERRLTAVERAVAELRQMLVLRPQSPNWLDKVAGSVTDEAAFLEALAYGRAFRSADRPSDGLGDAP
jgi:hypothetical protein